MNAQEIAAEAKREIEVEELRAAIDREKVKLRARRNRPWWVRVFPWRIKLEKL